MKTVEIKRKSMHEIIDETVEFYSNNPRSVNDEGRCRYIGPNGEQCAFARLVTNPEQLEEGVSCNGSNFKAAVFKPGYSGYGVDFYWHLQKLHDNSHYWGNGGLSEQGLKRVRGLKELFV